MNDKRFAILIDADNISAKYIKIILDEVSREGVATIRRMYADWTEANKKSWKDIALEYSLTPIQQFANTKNKNSTDSAMIIDAMDILYSNKVDGFCICSSDSDFTRLAARLRESGKRVIGMGESNKAKTPMISACETYKFLDLLVESEEKKPTNDTKPAENEETIKSEIDEIIASSEMEGYALSSHIGSTLKARHPEFDPRYYGCKKLLDLFVKFGFKTEKVDETGGTIKVFAR